ncbi:uncharacterized protein LOC126747096 [Anthonomus grandis grandis]|uniref:uncharacterized protein LOC126747096 n=1 Tax=Anthonomus grandis grandis TaxID=2921223 RepID=UPI002166AE31|nr:uncharacterized protein LOC126747096 [Anthonomus grandis grandis]
MRASAAARPRKLKNSASTPLSVLINSPGGVLCAVCQKNRIAVDMSVPQAAFAVKKLRKNTEKREEQFFHGSHIKEETSRYNSKYMNSIWGMYNRFSCHNLKKVIGDHQPQAQANVGPTLKGLANTSSLSVSVERLSYLPL